MKFYILLLFTFSVHLVFAQTDTLVVNDVDIEVDSIVSDTSISKVKFLSKAHLKEIFGKEKYPNPKLALILSLAVPGAGQLYNKKYWKIPVVYAGLGGLVYAINYNTENYHAFRDSYNARTDNNPETIGEFSELSNAAILSYRNKFDKRRQQVWLGFFAVWLLNSTEAFIDAHLMKFDVSDDLTMQISPYFDGFEYGSGGVSLGFSF